MTYWVDGLEKIAVIELNPHIFETVMLLCFGCSWPFAIAKTIRSKTVEGKSIIFITLIFIGYIAGIIFKCVGNLDRVIWLYITNGAMVFTEILLFFRYRDHGFYYHMHDVKRKKGRLHQSEVAI